MSVTACFVGYPICRWCVLKQASVKNPQIFKTWYQVDVLSQHMISNHGLSYLISATVPPVKKWQLLAMIVLQVFISCDRTWRAVYYCWLMKKTENLSTALLQVFIVRSQKTFRQLSVTIPHWKDHKLLWQYCFVLLINTSQFFSLCWKRKCLSRQYGYCSSL